MKYILILTAIIIAAIVGYFGHYYLIMRSVTTPSYTVITKSNNIEIRAYKSILTAQVEIRGDRQGAIKQGFKVLAGYIFGNNVSMTAPVQQQESVNIKMTAPVMQQKEAHRLWEISFIMPAKYTLMSLPKPVNPKIKLLQLPPQKAVVIRYAGRWTTKLQRQKLQKLEAYIHKHKLKTVGGPIYAYYNPPWTLPFMRRNEVMFLLAE